MRLRILFASFVALLFLALNAFGSDDGYTRGDDGYYYKDGVPYSKYAYYYRSYYPTGYSYGGSYYRIEYSYERAYPPEPKAKNGRPDYAAMRVELAKAMKAQTDAVLKERELAFEHSAFLELLEASGLKDTLKFKVQPAYPLTSGFTNAFSTGTQYGSHGIQGQTVYGYGSHLQADLYSSNALDVNLAMQAGAAYLKNSQELTGDGFARLTDIVGKTTEAQAARQERFMELLMRHEGLRQYYQSVKPQDKLSISKKEYGVKPLPTGLEDVMQNVLRPACASCHSGNRPEGGWNVESYPSLPLSEKMKVWKRVTADPADPIHMPRSKSGGPGPQLSPESIRKILAS